MNSTKTNLVHPQTEEIPAPLEIHPSVSDQAASLLMKVCEIFSANPERYNQQEPNDSCGSAFCIIGHMRVVAGHRMGDHNAIGLTKKQWNQFFDYPDWPKQFCSLEVAEEVPAAVAIARIEHFLRTGE